MTKSTEIMAPYTVLLNDVNYGHWKVRMKANIRAIDEDVWQIVQNGWEEPCVTAEDGSKTPKTRWTATEKRMSKFNAKALVEIFKSVNQEQFELIQGCESAKEAWDILQNAFEGTANVRRTRLDMLSSQFENIKMNDDEKVGEFSAKLNSIANAAKVLGKNYNDAKLVKKLLRCLPAKFAAHKAVIKMTMNTDELKFAEAVGMLKAEEMEMDSKSPKVVEDLAITVDEDKQKVQKIEEFMCVMIRKLEETMDLLSHMSQDKLQSKEERKKRHEVECYNCHGIGHVKSVCPSFKRKEIKCNKCNGYGHTKAACVNTRKREKRMARSWSDTESNSHENSLNLVALSGFMKPAEGSAEHDSASLCVTHNFCVAPSNDSESVEEVDNHAEVKNLYQSWVKLSNEKLQLIKDKRILEAKVNILELEKDIIGGAHEMSLTDKQTMEEKKTELLEELMVERQKNTALEDKIIVMQDVLLSEKEKNEEILREFNENKKHIRMLNNGSENLDKILSVGQPPKAN